MKKNTTQVMEGHSGGSVEDGTSVSVQTTSSSPENGGVNKRASMVSSTAASVSSTSSSLHHSQQGDSASFTTKLGDPPVSNKAVIVKDSNHANFLTTLPYPAPPQLTNDAATSSSSLNNAAPATAPLPLIPNNNWVPQSTGGNETTMIAMPFQPHLQVGHLNTFHQQLLNNHAAANASASHCTIQAPPSSATAANNAANKDFDTEITIARANEVAREAQKALERAYRKRKQEAADEDDIMAAATASAQQYQQVQVQPQHPQQQQQAPQQQQIILPPDYQKLIQQPVYAMMQNQQQLQPTRMDFSAANDNQAVNNIPPSSSFGAPGQTIDYASLGKQLWSQLNPQLLQELAQMGGFPPLPPPSATATTGAPPIATLPQTTVSTATNNNVAPFRTPMPPSNQQPRPSNGSSSPIMFDDLFSKLLSTTLPPPEELFDDESSAGQLSDFDAELQALG